MKARSARVLLAALVAAGAMACAGQPETDKSPSAVPGMGEETAPALGTGVTEVPDN